MSKGYVPCRCLPIWSLVLAGVLLACLSIGDCSPAYAAEAQAQVDPTPAFRDDGATSSTLSAQARPKYYYEHCYTSDDDENLRIGINNDTDAYISQYFSTEESYAVPSQVRVNGKVWDIIGIDESAFTDCPNLTSIYIPPSITVIGDNAFENRTKLRQVTGCEGVQYIDPEAFLGCSQLNSFPFGSALRVIGDRAFEGTGVTPAAYPANMMAGSNGDYRVVDARLYLQGTENYKQAYKVLAMMNKERTKEGLQPLTMDADLMKTAMLRAAETAVYFSHTRPSGDSCFTASSKMWGENIASGTIDAKGAMSMWMGSTGHKANILNSSYETVGIGCFTVGSVGPAGPIKQYFVQCFGKGSNASAKQPKNRKATYAIDCFVEDWDLNLYIFQRVVRSKAKKIPIQVMLGKEGLAIPVMNKSFTFSSSNKKVAKVNRKGTLTIKSNGKTKLTAKTKTGNVVVQQTMKVKRAKS